MHNKQQQPQQAPADARPALPRSWRLELVLRPQWLARPHTGQTQFADIE